jgi:hypothetical protein
MTDKKRIKQNITRITWKDTVCHNEKKRDYKKSFKNIKLIKACRI